MSKPSDLTTVPQVKAANPLPHTITPVDLTRRNSNSNETMMESIVEGDAAPTTDSEVRYAAYASRIRTIMLSAHRYVAYTSDVGESFRPIAHPWLIKGAYGVSWAYLIGDVAHEGYKAYVHNQRALGMYGVEPSSATRAIEATDLKGPRAEDKRSEEEKLKGAVKAFVTPEPMHTDKASVHPLDDYRTVMVQRGIFQSLASMGLPAFTIHSIVRYSGRALKDVKNVKIRTWGPIGLGLAAVPALPFMFDAPVEYAVDWVFENGYKAIAGKSAVKHVKEHEKEL